MKVLRRILGILVMIAGVLGLVLSVAGLVGVWTVKPTLETSISATIDMLKGTIATSQQAMDITKQALGATVDSVAGLSAMLSTTADSVEDTKPVVAQVNTMLSQNLPATLQSANDSLRAAQESAVVLDSAIRSLVNFQTTMGAVPLVSAFVEQPAQPYDPEKPLAESLGEVAANMEELPAMFTAMAEDLDTADNNMDTIQTGLADMSASVSLIAQSLGEYEAMITQSQSSMGNLGTMLTNLQANLANILNGAAIGLSLFFFWLLAAQVVIFSQGWELFQGTAGRMEGTPAAPVASEPVGLD
jgi:uncharacterized protein YoxC